MNAKHPGGAALTAAGFAEEIARIIYNARARLSFRTEAQLQQALEELFEAEELAAVSQPRLGSRDRPDFMIGGLVLELKRDGNAAALERQLARYASHDEVTALLVVTNRARHQSVSREIGGKPVRVAWISGAAG